MRAIIHFSLARRPMVLAALIVFLAAGFFAFGLESAEAAPAEREDPVRIRAVKQVWIVGEDHQGGGSLRGAGGRPGHEAGAVTQRYRGLHAWAIGHRYQWRAADGRSARHDETPAWHAGRTVGRVDLRQVHDHRRT